MKYNQTSPKIAAANTSYINERWSQLSDLTLAWSNDAIKYLFLTNSGAAATVLAFMGAVEGVRTVRWVWGILILFTVGIIFVGFLHISRVVRIERLYKNWRVSTVEYYESRLDWETMVLKDNNIAYSFDWGRLWGYGAFGCFVAGVLIGVFYFNLIAMGESHGRQQQTTQAVHPTAASTAGSTGKIVTGHSPGLDKKRPPDSRLENAAAPANQEKITPEKSKESP